MKRDDWIESRVIWRLGKHGRVKDTAATGANIPDEYLAAVYEKAAPEEAGRPVMAFSDNNEQWTLLATELIASKHSGDIHTMHLHNGFRVASPFNKLQFDQISSAKAELQFLSLVHPNSDLTTVWAPKGSPCFSLWNILLMFPFNQRADYP